MESSSRRSLEGGSWTWTSSQRRRFSSSLQLQGMLMFTIFTSSHLRLALSKRDESITSSVTLGPWNKTLYKIERGCLDFHEANASSYFYFWPEEDFNHCCTYVTRAVFASKKNRKYRSLENFTYGVHGPPLLNGDYFDVGLIDHCLPYWKFRCLLRRMYRHELYKMQCEYVDLRNFYRRRFRTKIVLNYGLLQSALPIIVFLEVLVMSFAALYWLIWGRRGYQFKEFSFKATFKDWFRLTRKTVLLNWFHLSLLAVIGNGLLESVGRQNPYNSMSESFYTYSLLYLLLTLLVWISSFMYQLSYLVSVIEDRCVEYDKLPTLLNGKSHVTRQTSESMKLKVKMGLNMEWKLQPIGAQAGILFCLWAYLTNVGSDAEAFFGLVVAAAAPWSGLYALRVIFACVCFLVKLRLSVAEKRGLLRMRRLVREVMHMTKRPSGANEEAERSLAKVAESEELPR